MSQPSTAGREYNELRIRLLRYPIKLSLRAEEHVSEWTREFKLIAFASGGESEPSASPPQHRAPARLVQLAEQLQTVFASEVSEAERQRARAYAEGRESVDLEFPTIPETQTLVLAWQDVIHQVDEFCRADELLTLARPPDVAAFGDWVFTEFVRQLDGEEPKPWTGPLD
jgi:hypothetical protein